MTVAQAGPLDELQRGRLDLLQGSGVLPRGAGATRRPSCWAPRRRSSPSIRSRARDVPRRLERGSSAGKLASGGSLYDLSRETRGAAPGGGDASVRRTARRLRAPGRRALRRDPLLQQAATGLPANARRSTRSSLGWLATVAPLSLGLRELRRDRSRGVQLARDAGALTVPAVGLHILTEAVTMGGASSARNR